MSWNKKKLLLKYNILSSQLKKNTKSLSYRHKLSAKSWKLKENIAGSKNFFTQRSIGGNPHQPSKSTAPPLASKEASGDDETAPELIPSEKDKKTNWSSPQFAIDNDCNIFIVPWQNKILVGFK